MNLRVQATNKLYRAYDDIIYEIFTIYFYINIEKSILNFLVYFTLLSFLDLFTEVRL